VTIVNGEPASSIRVPLNNNTRIVQGQCIEVGGYYDVSGVIGFTTRNEHNAFDYYGRWQDGFDPTNNETRVYHLEMPDSRISYYQFYADPKIFGERLGYWYQDSGVYERAANKRAFYVSDRCATDANATTVVVDDKPVLINPRQITPRSSGADILLASDDPLQLPINGTMRKWVFGNSMPAHGEEVTSPVNDIFTASEIRGWSTGKYTLLLQYAGADRKYGVDYTANTRGIAKQTSLVPLLRSQDIVDITAYTPLMTKDALTHILDRTDDPYTTRTILVQEPYVDIEGYQELRFGNQTLLEVAGYTNKMAGTPITIYIDRDDSIGRSLKYPGMTFTTENASLGDYRTFHGFIPLYYENLAAGVHNITAVLPSGKSMTVDMYIRAEPEPHYQEPTYYKFVDGHPFIPIPTPQIIEKEVVREVVKTEYKTIIEKEPVNYDKLAWETISRLVVPAAAVIVVAGIPLAYILSVVVRAFAERRKRKIEENKP
jgi:hypothetical protein